MFAERMEERYSKYYVRALNRTIKLSLRTNNLYGDEVKLSVSHMFGAEPDVLKESLIHSYALQIVD